MPPRSRLSIAKPDVVATFERAGKRVFTRAEIEKVLADNRGFWRLAVSTTTQSFIDYLVKNTPLEHHRFGFPKRPTSRYAWGSVPAMEVIQSLEPAGYFSHYTAMYLHGMTQQVPKIAYFNIEQLQRSGGGELTQAGINRAFAGKCRVSSNRAEYSGTTVCILNGGNTDCLGVVDLETFDGARVRVTSTERTLIDIAVRPVYSGGVFEVANAYKEAQHEVSANKLVSYLKTIGYTYPYHQAIGFYMDHAGNYSRTQLSLLRALGMEFDFYLAHKIGAPEYNKSWRLFIPKGL